MMALTIPSFTTVRAAHFIFLRVVPLMHIGSKGFAARIGGSRMLLDEVSPVSRAGADNVLTLLPCSLCTLNVHKALPVVIDRSVALRVLVVARIDFPVVAARISELPSSIDEVFVLVPAGNVCMFLPCNVLLPAANVQLARL